MPKNRAFIVLISAAAIIGISLGVRQANGLFQLSITGELGVGREVFGFAIALGFLAFGLAQPNFSDHTKINVTRTNTGSRMATL